MDPFAELYHYESISRGLDDQGEKAERYNKESEHFRENGRQSWKQETPITTRISLWIAVTTR